MIISKKPSIDKAVFADFLILWQLLAFSRGVFFFILRIKSIKKRVTVGRVGEKHNGRAGLRKNSVVTVMKTRR